jgi:hypothetical protein
MIAHHHWLVVPIVGLCIIVSAWLWLRLTRPEGLEPYDQRRGE